MKKIMAAVVCVLLLLCAYGCNSGENKEVSEHSHVSESNVPVNESTHYAENDVSFAESSLADENSDAGETSESADNSEVSAVEKEDNSTEQGDVSEDSISSEESYEESVSDEPEKCSHETTKTIGVVSATCTKYGYSGDTVCSECGEVLKNGSAVKSTGHINTKIINTKIATSRQEGYTGDTYCYDCGQIIETGIVIDKVVDKSDKATYVLPDGSKITIDKTENIRDYLLHLYTQYIGHSNDNVEKEILRLVNIEREKAGVAPLEWNEDGYFFAEIRAEECCEFFSHTRPNGCGCETVYSDYNVLLSGYWGENLGRVTDNVEMTDTELAELIVDAWMNSPEHKDNLLNEHYTSVSIAYIHVGGYHIFVQNFFGE